MKKMSVLHETREGHRNHHHHHHHHHHRPKHHRHHHHGHHKSDSQSNNTDNEAQDSNSQPDTISFLHREGDEKELLNYSDYEGEGVVAAPQGTRREETQLQGWTGLLTSIDAKTLLSLPPQEGAMVTIETGASISQLLNLLTEHNLLSLPVVSPEGEFLGFVDSLDIAGYVLSSWRRHSAALESGKFPAEEFFETTVDTILDFSHVDPSVVVAEDTSVLDLIDIFSDPRMHLRLHRLAVVNSSKQLVGIVSQSRIISFVHSHIKDLPEEMQNMRIREMGMSRSLIFAMVDSPFIDTLETLYRNRISGLALLNDQFQLAGNISTSDLRGLSPTSFNYFLGSTLQFLVKGRKGDIKPPMSVSPDTLFPKLLDLMVNNKIHRVYISDGNGRPHSLITQGDVIARLV